MKQLYEGFLFMKDFLEQKSHSFPKRIPEGEASQSLRKIRSLLAEIKGIM